MYSRIMADFIWVIMSRGKEKGELLVFNVSNIFWENQKRITIEYD